MVDGGYPFPRAYTKVAIPVLPYYCCLNGNTFFIFWWFALNWNYSTKVFCIFSKNDTNVFFSSPVAGTKCPPACLSSSVLVKYWRRSSLISFSITLQGWNHNAVVTIIKWHYCIPVSISQHMKGRYGHFHVIIFKHFFEQTFVIQSSGHKSSNQNTKPEESNDNFVKHNLSPKIFTWTLRLVFQSAGEHKDVPQEKLLERRKIYHHMAIQKLLASYNYEDWLFDGDMETEGKTLL